RVWGQNLTIGRFMPNSEELLLLKPLKKGGKSPKAKIAKGGKSRTNQVGAAA
ncbi:unnamed protein product, partial [Sphenostylis stenocarpa]